MHVSCFDQFHDERDGAIRLLQPVDRCDVGMVQRPPCAFFSTAPG